MASDTQHEKSVLETNAMLTIVPRVMGEILSISFLTTALWGATAGLASPRSSVIKLLAISWELRRQIDSRVKLKLHNDIGKNTGPEIEKVRKRRRECRRRKRQEKIRICMEKRVEMMASKTKVMTWNAQKANLDYPRSGRFVEMLKYVRKTSAKIVFFSEITSKQHGILWIKVRELYGVVIYGHEVAIFLRDDWADDWEKQGCQRWVSERVVAVKVKKHRLVACYQPIWGSMKRT